MRLNQMPSKKKWWTTLIMVCQRIWK